MEGHQAIHKVRNQLIHPFKGDLIGVHRESVERWPMQTGETLQPIQSPFLVEHLRIALHGVRCIEDAGTSTGGFLCGTTVRSGIRAQKETGVSTGGRFA